MKSIKLLFSLFTLTFIMSCSNDDYVRTEDPITLEMVLSEYELWYVDYDRTTGTGEVPFMSTAFTLSFINGKMFANNNLVGIGSTGNGLGVQVGFYDTDQIYLIADHDLDGLLEFEVIQQGENGLKFYNQEENVTYYLEGYQIDTFDYDLLFYDNIEYFLQEYLGWEKTFTDAVGGPFDFDFENYLKFPYLSYPTFESSEDATGINIEDVFWDFEGSYEVFDLEGEDYIKGLLLNYEGGGFEDFDLTVLDDGAIELYNIDTNAIYEFEGRSFIQYLKNKGKKDTEKIVSNGLRKRTKVERKTKVRKKHLK
jgi:hypothetical protein